MRHYLEAVASYIIVGIKGLQDREWFAKIATRYPGKIYLGLDVKVEKAALNGWTEVSEQNICEVAESVTDLPLGSIVYTDTTKDGKLGGPNRELTVALVRLSKTPYCGIQVVYAVSKILYIKKNPLLLQRLLEKQPARILSGRD
ncbi:HisA/HisF-related TIM barrel protein [Carnobacterium iners]|uniref:HisA/HisF-related TIM barrel protein n=1 Tax=Carnobacterium iners TaxID=1073423 RepID=UPI00210A0066|nr:HisA/HisF-related TIM barrel protein [Carnobacterium iners]